SAALTFCAANQSTLSPTAWLHCGDPTVTGTPVWTINARAAGDCDSKGRAKASSTLLGVVAGFAKSMTGAALSWLTRLASIILLKVVLLSSSAKSGLSPRFNASLFAVLFADEPSADDVAELAFGKTSSINRAPLVAIPVVTAWLLAARGF